MTDTNNLSLEDLKALMAKFSASDLKKAVESVAKDKPTLLSVTMDCIVAANIAGSVISADVTKAVTAKAREAGAIKPDEDASATSVAALIRYAKAFDEAMARAGFEWSKRVPVDGDAPITDDGDAPITEPQNGDKSENVELATMGNAALQHGKRK